MSLLSRLFSQNKNGGRDPRPAGARLTLEALEDRTLLSSARVVPLAQGIDNHATFHRLVDALGVSTAAGDIVTIEPGSTADTSTVAVADNGITIQSDPNTPGSILPVYNLLLTASNVTLSRLNLGTVTINPNFTGNAVVRSQLNTVNILGGTSGAGGNVIDQDVITGSVILSGTPATPQSGNRITNNTFNSFTVNSSNAIIAVADNSAVVVQNNVIVGAGSSGQDGISITRGVNHLIANNTIALNGADLTSHGIIVQNPGGGPLMTATVTNNSIVTGHGVGLFLNAFSDTSLQALVQGNDFHGNAIGVDYLGSGGSSIASDLGGGSNGLGSSLGGNNFRGFPAQGTNNGAAIRLNGVGAGSSLAAELNIFDDPNSAPNTVFVGGLGGVDLTQALSNQRGFVQTLFNDLLGRTGTVAELDTWVKVLTAAPTGQANVVNGILRSDAALGRIVDSYYLKFLGRTSDQGGRNFWVGLIKNGSSLESIQAGFISSTEFLSSNNSDYIQGLYRTFLGRTGSVGEVAFWYGKLQQTSGLATTAQGFAAAAENRGSFVQTVFTNLLHRTPSTADVNFFANQKGDLLALQQQILSTPEFFSKG